MEMFQVKHFTDGPNAGTYGVCGRYGRGRATSTYATREEAERAADIANGGHGERVEAKTAAKAAAQVVTEAERVVRVAAARVGHRCHGCGVTYRGSVCPECDYMGE